MKLYGNAHKVHQSVENSERSGKRDLFILIQVYRIYIRSIVDTPASFPIIPDIPVVISCLDNEGKSITS